MIKLLIPENAGDLRVIEDAVQQCCDFEDGKIKKNTSMEGVFVKPNIPTGAGDWAKWVVIDNRSRQCYTEDFATLDGAMSYATDLHTSTQDQAKWDVPEMFYTELVDAVTRKTKAEQDKENLTLRDPLAYWIPHDLPHGGDHDALVTRFVDAMRLNVFNHHTVRYFTEVDEVAVGELQPRYMVELTYLNASEERNEIDKALRAITGADWRKIGTDFATRAILKNGFDPDKVHMEKPDFKVTYDYLEDDNDIVHKVVAKWDVGEEAWKAMNPIPDLRGHVPMAQGECPNCRKTVSLEWDTLHNGNKAFCPHCGSPMLKLHETEEHNDEQV